MQELHIPEDCAMSRIISLEPLTRLRREDKIRGEIADVHPTVKSSSRQEVRPNMRSSRRTILTAKEKMGMD